MSAKTILYATDYSTGSDLVLELAAVLARQHEATLLLVHVAEAEEYPVGERFDVQPAANPAALRRLQEVVPPDPDVPFRHQLLYGPPGSAEVTKPADEIVKLANQEKVDMIVLGTHGRTGLKYLLVGSVAEAVLRRASCPVVTVMLPRVSAATGQLAGPPLEARPIEMLSELLLAQRFSLAIYLRYGHQWTRAGDEPIVKAIRRISDDHELHADRITQLLLGREASVPHGHFPLEFTAHDETALSYLLPKLIQHERQMVERIEQSRGDWGADAEVRRLLETLLGVEKGHLETLTQLERALHSTS